MHSSIHNYHDVQLSLDEGIAVIEYAGDVILLGED